MVGIDIALWRDEVGEAEVGAVGLLVLLAEEGEGEGAAVGMGDDDVVALAVGWEAPEEGVRFDAGFVEAAQSVLRIEVEAEGFAGFSLFLFRKSTYPAFATGRTIVGGEDIGHGGKLGLDVPSKEEEGPVDVVGELVERVVDEHKSARIIGEGRGAACR